MSKSSVSGLGSITVCYLARGANDNAVDKMEAFAASYARYQPGITHELAIIYKGFRNAAELGLAAEALKSLAARNLYLHDLSFDLGAYFAAASRLDCETVCFLNTSSEILADDWLAKLAANLARSDVGMVSCSGSYEAPTHAGPLHVPFPNPHLRSNAFMMDRRRFLSMRPASALREKTHLYLIEHGPDSMTRRIARDRLKTLVVGRDGRGYEPRWWPQSRTFRQGSQTNLLIGDNRTRDYETAAVSEKKTLFALAWGDGDVVPNDPIFTTNAAIGTHRERIVTPPSLESTTRHVTNELVDENI